MATLEETGPLKFLRLELAPMSNEIQIQAAENETFTGRRWRRQFSFGHEDGAKMASKIAQYAKRPGETIVGLLDGADLVGLSFKRGGTDHD